MGEEKHENEELIRWGWPEDVWFHVDKVSSAHGETLDDVPQVVLEDCAQLVKANSIQGNKMGNVDVVYTMWENLKKTGSMDVGQVGFHRQKEVRSMRVEKRVNEIVNRLNKTKTEEKMVDFRGKRETRDADERDDKKAKERERRRQEKELHEQKAKDQELKSYTRLMKTSNMKTNEQTKDEDSDDFM